MFYKHPKLYRHLSLTQHRHHPQVNSKNGEQKYFYGHRIGVVPTYQYNIIQSGSDDCSSNSMFGMYANLESGCQGYHVCHGGRKDTFMCPQGTLFNQELLVCDHWYRVQCPGGGGGGQPPLYPEAESPGDSFPPAYAPPQPNYVPQPYEPPSYVPPAPAYPGGFEGESEAPSSPPSPYYPPAPVFPNYPSPSPPPSPPVPAYPTYPTFPAFPTVPTYPTYPSYPYPGGQSPPRPVQPPVAWNPDAEPVTPGNVPTGTPDQPETEVESPTHNRGWSGFQPHEEPEWTYAYMKFDPKRLNKLKPKGEQDASSITKQNFDFILANLNTKLNDQLSADEEKNGQSSPPNPWLFPLGYNQEEKRKRK